MMKEYNPKENAPNYLNFVLFLVAMLLCVTPWVSAAVALFLGIIMAALGISPLEKYSGTIIRYSLQVAVVGLGFGMDLQQAVKAGKEGFLLTLCSIFITLSLGIFLGRKFKLSTHTTLLIAAGTAICGGSAIAALAPLLSAKKEDISVSLGIIFLLNALALFIFPWMGGLLHLSQHQFGLWSAIAIQDTSSVVAAAETYGSTALKIATTVKLERALWIIPVSLICLLFLKREDQKGDTKTAGKNSRLPVTEFVQESKKQAQGAKIRIPWFIFLFLLVMVLSSYLPVMRKMGHFILPVSQKLLSLTLFFIGTGFTGAAIKKVGVRPLVLGVLLWCFIGSLSLMFLLHFM
ncbi:conserved hypothetical integral membrane protein [Arachidicoccus rhizosphaerae]|uniref:Conserved hypothetical integral membrane protein n=1 Tax=Arachidicoccus rhizosphaerae TaxID=551991 RepID=A0A1H3YG18_9BACT|nr:putative sulfate exporter family transporter [Arachidicoccus rhizosphaerae]SEA09882.1 conserved hypothetical integral membrane protein [Arachidicoccus rhizosphaerae]